MKSRLSLFLLLTLSCSQNPVIEANVNKIVVLSILNPTYTRQTIVLVEGTNIVNIENIDWQEIEKVERPVQQANVFVRSATQNVRFSEISPGLYQDAETKLQVVPGETYFLEVEDSQGRQLRASTTVPGEFHIISPENGSTFAHLSPVDFTWQLSEGAFVYEVGRDLLDCELFTDSGRFSIYTIRTTTNFTFRSFMSPRCDSTRQFQMHRVLAYDPAASAFLHSGSNLYDSGPAPTTNIENGAGVFGAMASDSLTIIVVPQN